MKKVIILLVLIQFFVKSISAQYNLNRFNYNVSDYQKSSKHYSPLFAGIGSSIIPGLGQLFTGEPGRGISIYAANLGTLSIAYSGLLIIFLQQSNYKVLNTGILLTSIGFCSNVSLRTWAVFDAIRVAKINSIAYDDKHKTSRLHINIGPSITRNVINSSLNVGLKLNVNF